jgi:hypothetical protein
MEFIQPEQVTFFSSLKPAYWMPVCVFLCTFFIPCDFSFVYFRLWHF